jgi:hypothetical protein
MVAEGNGGGEAFNDEDPAIWASFVRTPGLSSYEPLRTHARRAGDWPAWRTKALDTIRRSIASTTKGYGESIRLLEKAQSIADRLDRTADFRALIARLRTEHRRRNLQKRLDQKKW